MTISTPHYLLFSESNSPADRSAVDCTGGRWRFVLESVDGSTQFSAADEEGPLAGDRLDLLAVIRGLEALDQPSRVTLMTDSRYVSRGIRFGLDAWRESEWQWESFGKKEPVPNADLWQRVDRALRIHEVRCRVWQFHPMSEFCETGSVEIHDWAAPAMTVPQQSRLPQTNSDVRLRPWGWGAGRRWREVRWLLASWWQRLWTVGSGARTLACS